MAHGLIHHAGLSLDEGVGWFVAHLAVGHDWLLSDNVHIVGGHIDSGELLLITPGLTQATLIASTVLLEASFVTIFTSDNLVFNWRVVGKLTVIVEGSVVDVSLLAGQIVPAPVVVILNDVDVDHPSLDVGPSLLLLQLGDDVHA